MERLQEFFGNGVISAIIDIYIILVLVLFVFKFLSLNSKTKSIVRQIFIFLLFGLIAKSLSLKVSGEVYEYIFKNLFLMLVIIFSPEIRQMLLGFNKKSKKSQISDISFFEIKKEVLDAVDVLSRDKIGALITFERKQFLDEFIQKSTSVINATVNSELLVSIFTMGTPLHDGGVIIVKDKIKCAGAYYPSTERSDLAKNLGSRHRAAIGMSEMNDSLTISVSEESGKVSVSLSGILDYGIDRNKLEDYLDKYVDTRKWW